MPKAKKVKIIKRSVQWYGWIPDYPDFRDLKFIYPEMAPQMEIPEFVDLSPGLPPVYNQSRLGSCTAQAICTAYDYERKRQGHTFLYPSRLFLYFNERDMEGMVFSDAGAMIRDGIKSVAKQGLCTEVLWPYKIEKFARRPLDICYKTALQHQVLEYRRLSNNLSEMLSCLAQGIPFVFGFSVFSSFDTREVDTSGVVPMPQSGEELLGGHACVCIGFNQKNRTFLVRNSYGKSWGQAGNFTIPFEYLTNDGLAGDRWAITKLEIAGESSSPATVRKPAKVGSTIDTADAVDGSSTKG